MMLSVEIRISKEARRRYHGNEVGGWQCVIAVIVDGSIINAQRRGEDGSKTVPILGVVAVRPFEGEFNAILRFCDKVRWEER